MPNATVTIRELKNKETGIDIGIPTYKLHPGLLGSTVEYHIITVTNLQCFKLPKHKDTDVVQFMVPKSIDAFEDLKKKLSVKFPGTILPALPKRTFEILDSSINDRKTTLESFLKHIASTQKLASSPIFLQFLGASPYKVSKSRTEGDDGKPVFESGDATDLFDEIGEEQSGELFTDLAEEDLDLFKPGPKTPTSAGVLFGDLASANEGPSGKVKLFEEQDLRETVTKDDVGDLFLIPDTSTQAPQSHLHTPEDNSELLKVEDVSETVFKLTLDAKSKKKPTPPAKPSVLSSKGAKPELPARPKPKLAPKPSLTKPGGPAGDGKTKTSTDKGPSTENLQAADILKYIETNTTSAHDDDLDLFS